MQNIRLRYTKSGPAKYISHLDVNRAMLRTLQRSKVPVWYTEGFNPHPKLVFALPLPVGVTSDCEAADFRLWDDAYPIEEAAERLEKALPPGLGFVELYEQDREFSEIVSSSYEIILEPSDKDAEGLLQRAQALLNGEELVMEKTSKGKTKNIDILPLIREVRLSLDSGKVRADALLAAGTPHLSPELLMRALSRDEVAPLWNYEIHRNGIFLADGSSFR